MTSSLTISQARWYAATQPFIVDKTPFYEHIARDLFAAPSRRAHHLPRLTEIGVGPGGFLGHAAAQGWLPADWHVLGGDLSPAMLAEAQRFFATHHRPTAIVPAERSPLSPDTPGLTLVSGVEALQPTSPFYAHWLPPASQDAIVLSQFEHYAPNAEDSPLARRLRAAGRPWLTKAALRRWLVTRLRPGGTLWVLDDYAADSPALHRQWDAAWDAHVATQWSRPETIASLARVDATAAARLARHHAPSRPLAGRLALVTRTRERRRYRAGEEIQPLDDAWADFQALFGVGHCGRISHSNQVAFPQFFLFFGKLM